MAVVSRFLHKVCGIGFTILICFPTITNGEVILNDSFGDKLQSSQQKLKVSANKVNFGRVFKEFGVNGFRKSSL